jgi:hypothetical protein
MWLLNKIILLKKIERNATEFFNPIWREKERELFFFEFLCRLRKSENGFWNIDIQTYKIIEKEFRRNQVLVKSFIELFKLL